MSEKIDLLALFDAGQFIASRSSANVWLRENRDALIARTTGKRIDWSAVAKAMAAGGYQDARGKPPSAATLARAWSRIRGPAKAPIAPTPVRDEPDDDQPAPGPLKRSRIR